MDHGTVVLLIRGGRHGPAELCVARLRGEEEAHEAGRVPVGDGGGGAVGSARRGDRAALPQDRPAGRPAAVPSRRDAAHLLPATVVHALRSRRRGGALRHPVHARVLRPGAWSRRHPTPMCAFMPKYHWLPFFDDVISGSRLPAAFFVDGEAAISVASTIVPPRSISPRASRCDATAANTAFVKS